ncbi:LacI family DNA-binding transcriptional regulator [Paenibacillus turpanensis]|uniref:LacI family DNA-binding transcriptional regulator n=1 Tax=Paenibacillus turpanensis TaxID=2689078 RepID=UPI001409B077|nr:LacI family DNA-binding transcriptional regulator [Paenibacillus turpanensis]
MTDIAKMANVSKAAVSLALSGKPGISDETRAKILAIVKETGYLPRAMVKADQVYGLSRTLRFVACTNSGIVSDHFYQQPFFMELIHHIEEQCRANGYSLFFSSVPYDQFEQTVEELETEHKSNGILLLGTNLSRQQIEMVERKQPNLVVIDTCIETMDANFIVMNNKMGAYQAGKYLLDLGHRQIGYVQSNSRMYNFDSRKQGFLQALSEEGVHLPEKYTFTVSPTVVSSQEELKNSFMRLEDDVPTVLFCECDYIAISTMKSLYEMGYRVPDDISIIGFDNIQESRIVTPELTTVHVEKLKIAELAIAKLIAGADGREQVRSKMWIDTHLVIRDSCREIQVK